MGVPGLLGPELLPRPRRLPTRDPVAVAHEPACTVGIAVALCLRIGLAHTVGVFACERDSDLFTRIRRATVPQLQPRMPERRRMPSVHAPRQARPTTAREHVLTALCVQRTCGTPVAMVQLLQDPGLRAVGVPGLRGPQLLRRSGRLPTCVIFTAGQRIGGS